MIYFTSDLHLGHANIIRLCARPFTGLAEYEATLIKNWNNTVNTKDEVYILGDVAFKCSKDHANKILGQLNGTKYLLRGNHDGRYIDSLVLKWVKDYWELLYNKRLWVLGHYPFASWNGQYKGSINLCGHRHLRVKSLVRNQIDVGVDAWNFTPVSIESLEAYCVANFSEIRAESNPDPHQNP